MSKSKVKIDEEKCIGCGLCASICHQGVIEIINSKAKIINDNLCDNLGRCLPVCPTSAIVIDAEEQKNFSTCPGSISKEIKKKENTKRQEFIPEKLESNLKQWPVQIQLVGVNATYFKNADLLISADCCAYAYADFNRDFMKDKITIIGCPKLDILDYSEKLTEIIKNNNIRSVEVIKMEVPCCNAIEHATKTALLNSSKVLPFKVSTICIDGSIKESL